MKPVLRAAAAASLFTLTGCIGMGTRHTAIYRAICPAVTAEQERARFETITFGVADRLHMPRPQIRPGGGMKELWAPFGWHLPSSPQGPERSSTIMFSTNTPSWIDDSNFDAVILGNPGREDDAIRQVRAAIEAELRASSCTWTFNYQMKLS